MSVWNVSMFRVLRCAAAAAAAVVAAAAGDGGGGGGAATSSDLMAMQTNSDDLSHSSSAQCSCSAYSCMVGSQLTIVAGGL